MTATATDRIATEGMVRFLNALHAERVDFGYNPELVYTFREAKDLIDTGKRADRKAVVAKPAATPGYYVKGDTVYVVVLNKAKTRTYAKQLVISGRGRARWEFAPGAVRDLDLTIKLTEAEASIMGRQHGVCVVCAKELTDPKSVQAGIGPVCGKRLRVKMVEEFPAAPAFSTHDCEHFDGECMGWFGYHDNPSAQRDDDEDGSRAYAQMLERRAEQGTWFGTENNAPF